MRRCFRSRQPTRPQASSPTDPTKPMSMWAKLRGASREASTIEIYTLKGFFFQKLRGFEASFETQGFRSKVSQVLLYFTQVAMGHGMLCTGTIFNSISCRIQIAPWSPKRNSFIETKYVVQHGKLKTSKISSRLSEMSDAGPCAAPQYST